MAAPSHIIPLAVKATDDAAARAHIHAAKDRRGDEPPPRSGHTDKGSDLDEAGPSASDRPKGAHLAMLSGMLRGWCLCFACSE